MIGQWASLTAFALACLGLGWNFANAAPPPPQIVVNEAAAQATLSGKAIELNLPLSIPAPEHTRVTAWILSPADVPSNTLSTNLPIGAQSARLILSWPFDQRGNLVGEIV